jgi:hypothetical protein
MNLLRLLPVHKIGFLIHMRRPSVGFFVVVALLIWGDVATAQILTNGGFESGLSNWSTSLSSAGVATFSNEATYFHTGTNALRVTVISAGTASNSVSIVSARFTASGTNTYVLRFWANTDTLDANMGVNLIGASPEYPQIAFMLSTNSMASGDEHYQEYLYAFKASGSVSIAFNFQSTAQYWLDDVEILDIANTDGFDVPMTYLWQWGQWNFARTNSAKIGWTGGDNDKSCLLPDGSVAWIFNDSYASTLNSFYSNVRGNSSLPRNSLLHQIGTNLIWMNPGSASMFVPNHVNDNLMPLAPNGLYWIAGSIAESNQFYVLLNGLNNSPLTNICMAVATFSLPDMKMMGVVTNLTSPGIDNYGDLVRGDDNFYYIYNGSQVARVPVGQLAMNAAWTFWNGASWVYDHTQTTNAGASLPNFQGWSIAKLGTSNYVAVYKPVLSLSIYAQFAPSPMGPWGNDMVIATVPDQGGEGIFTCYMPNICMGTGSNGVFSIGYSDNGAPESWFSKTYSDKSWYNPHFVTAPLFSLSPYSLLYTNGGPGSRVSIKFAADQNYNNDRINNSYGAGVLNTTNWFNFGTGGGASGVTNIPFYTYKGQKYASAAKMVYNYASEMTHTVDAQAKSNNVALLESWINVNNNCWYLSVTNLDAPFTNGYSVYFYYHGSTVGFGGQDYLRYYAGRTTSSAALETRQWNLYTTDSSNSGTFIQDNTPGNIGAVGETSGANYCVFTNLSGGAFDLLVTNGVYGGVNAIEIVADTPPMVTGPIVFPSTNVYPGTSVSLTCSTNGGLPPFSINWQACGDGISWTNLIGTTQTNLVLSNFAAGNAGYYQMVYTAGSRSATSSVVELTVNPPMTMNVQQSGGNIILTWPQGVLLQATNLGGPWSTNNATSPYTNIPSSPQMFFRVKLQ